MNIKSQILFVEKIFFSLLLITLLKTNVFAQDIRSGEIIVSRIAGNTYQTKINIYQDLSNYVNRTHILLYWGDSPDPDTLQRIDTTIIDSFIGIKAMYSGIHSYPGPGIFVISYQDSFLLTGITNITNLGNEKFCLQDSLRIPINPIFYNSSPYFSNNQAVSVSCCNWSYNSGAVDQDGDSLSYSLAPYTCVSNYSYPNGIFIDSITGTLTMHPTSIGKFAIGIKIEEWKKINNNYILIGSILRPMLLNVDSLWSVNTTELSSLFDIFPNPCINDIFISISGIQNDKQSSVCIYNILGKKIRTMANINKQSNEIIKIDVSDFSSGIYLIEYKNNNKIFSKKFIKQ
ncbi:MAG: T9SS type A sorting domain-containing protein [Bacteroidia bacterium]|nr:T9SS type A sorting domain-containing protein [Bacteroidia bacterium]